jgi:uncharacterized protein YegP (UPF0339 family)
VIPPREDAVAAKFELYQESGGEHRWRLRVGDGQVIATSGEGYETRANARNGIEAVRKNAAAAAVVATRIYGRRRDLEAELWDKAWSAQFELYEGLNGKYRWRLKVAPGQVIATSGEGYTTMASAEKGVELVRKSAATATVEDD